MNMDKLYMEDIIKPLEEEIKKLYIKKQTSLFWSKKNEEKLEKLEKQLFLKLKKLEEIKDL